MSDVSTLSRQSTLWLAVAVCSSLLVALPTDEANAEEQKLTADDASADDEFGTSIAVDGDLAVVGAPRRDPEDAQGAAYVFTRRDGAWRQQQKLTGPDGSEDDWFGNSVAVDGETVVIGAPQADSGDVLSAGAAYVYTRTDDAWNRQRTLSASSDAALGGEFGASVAVHGDTVVVGAPRQDHEGRLGPMDAGFAYVFVRNDGNWTRQQKISASDASDSDEFGAAVDVDNDTIVVGAPWYDPDDTSDAGAAFVFVRNGDSWTERAALSASDGEAAEYFGRSVALEADTVVAGASADTHSGVDAAGSAYVFIRSGSDWQQQQKIVASDPQKHDSFGWNVAVTADTLLTGAGTHTPGDVENAGAAFLYNRRKGSWMQTRTLVVSDADKHDRLGIGVGLAAGTAIAGAPRDNQNGLDNTGSAYVYSLTSDSGGDASSGTSDAGDVAEGGRGDTGRADAGASSDVARDTFPTADGSSSGCNCRTTRESPVDPVLLTLLVLSGAILRRRDRAHG